MNNYGLDGTVRFSVFYCYICLKKNDSKKYINKKIYPLLSDNSNYLHNYRNNNNILQFFSQGGVQKEQNTQASSGLSACINE